MRRLVVEISGSDLFRFRERPAFRNVKSMQMLHFLRQDQDEVAAICRVELLDPHSTVAQSLEGGNLTEAQILERVKKGVYIIFIRGKPRLSSSPLRLAQSGGYLFSPVEISNGRIRLTFLGNARQVKKFLQKIEKIHMGYKTISMTDAKFSPNSPLSYLTDKQRYALLSAFDHGYYDVPRKISSEELAGRLGVATSTLVEHLRKGERRLLVEVLNQT